MTARAKLDELLDTLRTLAEGVKRDPDATVSDRIAVLRATVTPIKLLGQLTGEIGASETTIASSPHYRRVRAVIVEALRPHPAALRDVIAALERAEGTTTEAAA